MISIKLYVNGNINTTCMNMNIIYIYIYIYIYIHTNITRFQKPDKLLLIHCMNKSKKVSV